MPTRHVAETDNHGGVTQKIAELKKRILLSEGQKTAKSAERQKQNRINRDTISTLKKDIKNLAVDCGRLRHPLQRAMVIKEPALGAGEGQKRCASASASITAISVGKLRYPIGAKNIEDAIFLTDLRNIEFRKQLDLLRHHLEKRKQQFAKLVERYRQPPDKPLELTEDGVNRRLVCQLENYIHRNNVQWMEAEHIRKKYRCIGASLMNDAERFELSLHELEEALNEQQTEINRLQDVHNEAIEMRDAAKLVLQRQEQQAQYSQKTRERQAMDYRRQVEARKMELERIGRKLFIENKALVHQASVGSSSGDPCTAKTDADADEANPVENSFKEMTAVFKQLMEVTGATTPQEVLERFYSQKESTARLGYLRNAAEMEKSQLEAQRERLNEELEASKFQDSNDTEVNQEAVEKLQLTIASLEAKQRKDVNTAEHTLQILKHIREHLCEVIYKLQETKEDKIELMARNRCLRVEELPSFLVEEAEDEDYIEIIKLKLRSFQELNRGEESDIAEGEKSNITEDDLMIQLEPPKSPSVPEGEKPQPVPPFYYSLLPGRGQRAAGTSSGSPEQVAAGAAAPDDELEVPTRNYLKRQSVLIVDAKSRRKPFRATPAARRK